eukprot:657440-Heterocapsa_arctica.AAC.1
MFWGGQGKSGQASDPGWKCQNCGQKGNGQNKTRCRSCNDPHPIVAQGKLTYGQGGKGKGKKG